jgi:hypothetical protein
VLFVNVPIGLLTAAAARLVLPESARNRGRFDLPGAIAGTGGVALLVYGLSNAGADQSGVSHWGDTRVIASLTASALLLAGFVVIETRSPHALMPLRILANRSRSGAYLIMLALSTAGAAITTGGMYWFSRLSEHSNYPGGLLGPMLVTGVGLGLLFVPPGPATSS